MPHVGHVLTRVVKDLFPRYRTMRGYRVARKAGWDTHGLRGRDRSREAPRLPRQAADRGLRHRRTVQPGLPRQRRHLRAAVARDDRARRLLDRPRRRLLHLHQRLHRVGLVGARRRCARQRPARRGLQDPALLRALRHDALAATRWRRTTRTSTTRRSGCSSRRAPGQRADDRRWRRARRLAPTSTWSAWTTTPWTMLAQRRPRRPSRPRLPRRRASGAARTSSCSSPTDLELPVPLGDRRRTASASSSTCASSRRSRASRHALAGLRYDRPYARARRPARFDRRRSTPPSDAPAGGRRSATTSPPPTAPASSTPRRRSARTTTRPARRYGLPLLLTVDADGQDRRRRRARRFAGLWFKDADTEIIRDLKARGLLLHHERYRHSYPFCWRCDRPLLYYATDELVHPHHREQRASWWRRTSTIDWHPEHIGEGRFGNWLENVVDWALSRKRYWGTPLPIWRCDGVRRTSSVIGSYAELFAAAGRAAAGERLRPRRSSIRTGRTSTTITWPCAASASERAPCAASRRSSTPGSTPARCRSPSTTTRSRTGS